MRAVAQAPLDHELAQGQMLIVVHVHSGPSTESSLRPCERRTDMLRRTPVEVMVLEAGRLEMQTDLHAEPLRDANAETADVIAASASSR